MRSTAPASRCADRSPIPLSLMKLSGAAAPAILAVAAASPAVARRLVSWTPSYAHALSILLQARRAATPAAAKQLFGEDAGLEQADTAGLLRTAGFGRPERLVPLLDRLGARLHPLDRYREWEHLLADRNVAGCIRSGRKLLTRQKLEALAALHPELRSVRIMSEVGSPADAAALHAVVDRVCRLCPDASAESVRRSLRETKAEWGEWLDDWFAKAALPPPPFPGSETLVPLGSGAEVRALGRAWRNCLGNFLDDAVKGEIVFYRWTGGEPALVALRPLGQLGWIVDEINGPRNGLVSAATRRRIIAELADWGCFTDRNIIESLRKFHAYSLL